MLAAEVRLFVEREAVGPTRPHEGDHGRDQIRMYRARPLGHRDRGHWVVDVIFHDDGMRRRTDSGLSTLPTCAARPRRHQTILDNAASRSDASFRI